MMIRSRLAAGALLAAGVVLAACEEAPPSDVTFAQVRAESVDRDGFAAYFETLKGKKVAWSGRVTEVRRVFEDDYAETGVLFIDLDEPGADAGPDARMEISPSDLERFDEGSEVRFIAKVREYGVQDGRILLNLSAEELD